MIDLGKFSFAEIRLAISKSETLDQHRLLMGRRQKKDAPTFRGAF